MTRGSFEVFCQAQIEFLAKMNSDHLSWCLFVMLLYHSHTSVLGHECFSCADQFMGFQTCNGTHRKIVDSSGICANCSGVKDVSCSHQIGGNHSDCIIHWREDCSAESEPPRSVLQCQPDNRNGCHCPDRPSTGPGDGLLREGAVVVTAYPYICSCTKRNGFVTALDVRVRLTGWTALGLVFENSESEIRCREFQLSAAAARAGPGRAARVRMDCPMHAPRLEGQAVKLRLCTARQTLSFLLRLPLRANIGTVNPVTLAPNDPNISSWEPLILVHIHRSDKLVFSVQRAPPAACERRYRVELVLCSDPTCRAHRPVAGTERRLEEDCSASEKDAGSFRVEYDLPASGGNISLRVQPDGGRSSFSAVVQFPEADSGYLVVGLTVAGVLLMFIAAALVWVKVYEKRSAPEYVEVLVVYNSNANLAKRVAACLERYCGIKTKLDVVDIPRAGAGMDPVSWLYAEMARCDRVLLLVFPEETAHPIYQRLYPTAIHQLQMDAGAKKVVVAHASGGGQSAPLPSLLAAVRCRLPGQLGRAVRSLRAAGWWDAPAAAAASGMVRRLRCSPDGAELLRLLRQPAEPAPPLPLPPLAALAAAETELLPLPAPPKKDTDKLAEHVPSVTALLEEQPPWPPLPPDCVPDDDDDDEIHWH